MACAHAVHGGEAGGAVGEGALARQHHAVRRRHLRRVAVTAMSAAIPAWSAARARARAAEVRLPLP